MTLEQLIDEYNAAHEIRIESLNEAIESDLAASAADRKAKAAHKKTTEVENDIAKLRKQIVAAIQTAPGGKVYHKRSGIVYTASEHGHLSVIEAIYSTSEIHADADGTSTEDLHLAQNWAKCCRSAG
jgi:hypothetical protein